MALSRITVRACPGTTRPRPSGESSRPPAPKTARSTLTGFGPGLARTRCSRRPGAAPPATSHEEAAAGMQAVVTKPRLSPVLVQDHCVATVPGAIEPAPVTITDRAVETCPETTWPRPVTGAGHVPPDGSPLMMSEPTPR